MLGNLFNKKITVNFINAENGEVIGASEMLPDQLPDTFAIDTQLTIQDEEWSVEEAIPANKEEFKKTKQLSLKLRKIQYVNPKTILFTLPTVSNEFPETVENSGFSDFEITIHEDDWRQKEFLNASASYLAEKEIEGIKLIWNNESEYIEEGGFHSFKNIHMRGSIGNPNLNLDFSFLQDILHSNEIGRLKVDRYPGFVKNGFVLKTSSSTYYGIVEEGIVTQLCMQDYTAGSDTEIIQINSENDLFFVDWVPCKIIDDKVRELLN